MDCTWEKRKEEKEEGHLGTYFSATIAENQPFHSSAGSAYILYRMNPAANHKSDAPPYWLDGSEGNDPLSFYLLSFF